MQQTTIFDFTYPKYKITKPIRLIELFAGIGAQATALKRLNANFETYKIIEFDKYAIASYNAVHNTNFEVSDITLIGAEDLEIKDTKKYDYIMTYSFPCQSLSVSGKGEGMKKGSGTRSGLLWEVERLLDEMHEKPQILLMENVPMVISKKHLPDFRLWCNKLESLGYKNYFQNLNAKNYGIPQNRNRTFMVSLLGDYSYSFPKEVKLKLRLKDFLEDVVEEKYFLSDKMVDFFTQNSKTNKEKGNGFRFSPIQNTNIIAKTITTLAGNRMDDNFIIFPEATKKGYAEANEGDGVYTNRPHQKRGVVQKGMIQTIKTDSSDLGVVVKNNLKTQLCNTLIEKNLVKEHDVIRHSYTTSRTKEWERRNIEGNNISPTLDTRADCLGVVVKDKPKIKETENYFHIDSIGSIDNSRRAYKIDKHAPTLTSKSENAKIIYPSTLRIRKLTPRECWRLMGFNDEEFERAEKVNSNAQLYKQAGNSIVVNVLEAIFKELL